MEQPVSRAHGFFFFFTNFPVNTLYNIVAASKRTLVARRRYKTYKTARVTTAPWLTPAHCCRSAIITFD